MPTHTRIASIALAMLMASTAAADTGACSAMDGAEVLPDAFLQAIYPPEANPSRGVACAWNDQGGPCDVWLNHTGDAPDLIFAPTREHCAQDGPQSAGLRVCYEVAAIMTREALDAGSLAGLNRAMVRTGDVVRRARQSQSGPAWLRHEDDRNLLAAVFSRDGLLPSAQPAACVVGAEQDQYACMAIDPGFAQGKARTLIGVGRAHLARVAHGGDLTAAQDLALALFQSASAPQIAQAEASGAWSPVVHAMPGTDLLGEYFALRVIVGSAFDDGVAEVEVLANTLAWQPPMAQFPEIWTAGLMLTGAQHAAFELMAPNAGRHTANPAVAEDVIRFLELIDFANQTAEAMGVCAVSDQLVKVWLTSISLGSGRMLNTHLRGGPVTLADIVTGLTEFFTFLEVADMWGDGGDGGSLCGWVRFDEALVATTEPYSTMRWHGNNHCTLNATHAGGTIKECRQCFTVSEQGGIGLSTTTYDDECLTLSGGEYFAVHVEHDRERDAVELRDYADLNLEAHESILETRVVVDSIRAAYRTLLSNYDHATHFEDVGIDLHWHPDDDSTATIANARVSPEGCFETTPSALPASAADVDCSAGSDSDPNCTLGMRSLVENADFIPYAIAVRNCPEYLAHVTGLMEADDECTTPWGYIEAVTRFLRYAEPLFERTRLVNTGWTYGDADEEAAWASEDGESLETTLIDFAHEAALMSTSIVAALNRDASVALTVAPLSTTDTASDPYSANIGFDRADAVLEMAASIVDRAVGVLTEYDRIDGEVVESSLGQVMPRRSAQALAGLSAGACDGNGLNCGRALFYRRLADLVDAAQTTHAELFALRWREADGVARCLTGESGATICDDAPEDCDTLCAAYDATHVQAQTAKDTLAEIDAVLEAHRVWFSANVFVCVVDPSNAACVPEASTLRDFVDETRDDIMRFEESLDAQSASLTAGVDWLGFLPGYRVVQDQSVDALFAEVQALSNLDNFEAFVADTLAAVAQRESFEQALANAANDADSNLAYYCSDADGADPDGCGVGEPWTADGLLITRANTSLSNHLCNATLTIDGVPRPIGVSNLDPGDYDLHYEGLADLMTAMGLGDADPCPTLVAPDFDALDGAGGLLADDLRLVEATLMQLNTDLITLGSKFDDFADAFEALLSANEIAYPESAEMLSIVADEVGCVLGVGLIVLTAGGTAAKAIEHCTDVGVMIARGYTAEGIEEMWRGIEIDGIEAAGLMDLNTQTLNTLQSLLNYQHALQNYQGDVAAMADLASTTAATFDTLYANAFGFNPTAHLFADARLRLVRNDFRSLAQAVRKLQHALTFEMGIEMVEGRVYETTGGTRYLPRLSRLAVFGPYGNTTTATAAAALAGSWETDIDPLDLSLVNMAGLLAELYSDFKAVIGERVVNQDEFLVGQTASVGSTGEISENMGEWLMLADSPFYSGEANGNCPAGFIDIETYCDHEADAMALDDLCVSLGDYAPNQRRNLAWLDHMIRGDVETFACDVVEATDDDGNVVTDEHGDPIYTAWVRSAAGTQDDSIFASTDLGASTGNAWIVSHIDLQTEVVQALFAEMMGMRGDGETATSMSSLSLVPGDYLIGLDLTLFDVTDDEEIGESSTVLDLEYDAMGVTSATSTFAERIEGIALLCTNEDACGLGNSYEDGQVDWDQHETWYMIGGPMRQSDLCLKVSADHWTQHTNRFDTSVLHTDSNNDWTGVAAYVDNQGLAAKALLDATVGEDTSAGIPYLPSRMFIGIGGGLDTDTEANWHLYSTTDEDDAPAIRLAVRMSYYDGNLSAMAEASNFLDNIQCPETTCRAGAQLTAGYEDSDGVWVPATYCGG